jgi:succinylglutamate desuccinylase
MADLSTGSPGVVPHLERFDHFPDELLEVAAGQLWQHLRGPALFYLPGRLQGTVFVSVLLHGNEDTGWLALQSVLRQHLAMTLPRPLLVLVGNIAVAKAGVRTLPDQEVFNRVWPGTAHPDTPVARLMRNVVEIAQREPLFASIDIHNNSGNNPH